MELIKRELDENCTEYDLQDGEKHLTFSSNFLDHLNVKMFYDNGRYIWFSEYFDIKQGDSLFGLVDSIFFSYGGVTYFDTEGAGLSLEKKKNGDYSFVFDRTFQEKDNIIESTLDSYSMENESLRVFYNNLEAYSMNNKKEDVPMKKVLSPKHINKI